MTGYRPSRDAAYPSPWNIVLLVSKLNPFCILSFVVGRRHPLTQPWAANQSQRDVAFQIPINYTPHVSVALTPACFAGGNYTVDAAARCVSNLLASGFRRFFIDVYWNERTRGWQLCPVRTANPHDDQRESGRGRSVNGSFSGDAAPRLKRPQNATETIGHYTCSEGAWESIIDVFTDYITLTEDTLGAHLLFFILNPDFARPVTVSSSNLLSSRAHNKDDEDDDGDDDTPNSDDGGSSDSHPPHSKPKTTTPDEAVGVDAPVDPSSLSAIFTRTMGTSLYTPQLLQSERSNLNKTWYSVPQDSHPISEYFTVVQNTGHLPYVSTPDGWPCESYIEMVLGKRALVAFGEMRGGMTMSNFTSDTNLMFPPGSLATNANITASPGKINNDHEHGHADTYKGHIDQGCLYNPNDNTLDRSLDKWWYSPLLSPDGSPLTSPPLPPPLPSPDTHPPPANYTPQLAADIIDCGVSLLVNASLADLTADTHPGHYLDVVKFSVWSWADREPSSAGSASSLEDGRCAALDLTRAGQWRARDCSFHFYGACRVLNRPFEWVLTNKRVAYDDVDKHCPEGSRFSVPRTPLENTYLYAHALAQPDRILGTAEDDATRHSVWVDFNSMDVPQCWVVGHGRGGGAKCPYHIDERGISRKHVIVPTVAAIIALAITALMMLVKCNVNRRNSRRKRVIEGWEYEGVPA